ncbi:alpha/beta hydrolase [Pectobacterium parmentieri]|uniref:Alpha/beta hydrolase n=1 Tax=Pectobacterium parmentieri TaxID=1905730 RepID=A0A0H3ICE1_PECPM|nr:alpha/beta hydrolase [Pectobacterium parmentieri]AFI91684.1 Alpha/beta hydrolase fold protein [Pectobacterium parmentieri]MBI0472438.1 alpha/beta hydrolase [Pectobacterium parmentieri]MBI0495082.1 alpha/beta hydrolase [Pectobacterium parmentieri]MBI0556417.1 alpha/beta hydrolase [Pectobacterium parmentieri]MBI0569580.1 alpha/beta hydrolase [Pectobacterium parmentieri]
MNTDIATTSESQVHYRYELVGNVNIFYREAGKPSSPSILLLHGFAASSYMFRELIPALADNYHVIAPDLPSFGFTESPGSDEYDYTFDNLAKTIDRFTEQLKLQRYAIMVHDYGAPVGWRLATAHPDRITAIISQNGNAYEEGLAQGWDAIRRYWYSPTAENRAALHDFPTAASVKWQYLEGVCDTSLVSPDGYTLEGQHVSRPGNADIQLDLLLDYASNVQRYPEFQTYFREQQPPLLAVWGRHDPYFLPAGAEAWKRDIPHADIRFYDTGHFALETHANDIIPVIHTFLDDNIK